jgi:uncharacterized repeat protein (TIGR03803 family)
VICCNFQTKLAYELAEPSSNAEAWRHVFLAAIALVRLLNAFSCEAASHYERIRSFGFPDMAAQNPQAPLIQGPDGILYGTTSGGGNNDRGTVFKMNKDGTSFTACIFAVAATVTAKNHRPP